MQIRVYCRVRPQAADAPSAVQAHAEQRAVHAMVNGSQHTFSFNHVFGPDANQVACRAKQSRQAQFPFVRSGQLKCTCYAHRARCLQRSLSWCRAALMATVWQYLLMGRQASDQAICPSVQAPSGRLCQSRLLKHNLSVIPAMPQAAARHTQCWVCQGLIQVKA